MSEPNFVHLHLHTDYSLLDGACRIDRLAARCAELGMPAVAMTDHGNLFGAIDFFRKVRKAGVKPLIGCEIYLVHDHRMDEKPKRERKRSDDIDDVPEDDLGPEQFPKHQIHHKTLIARDFQGYQNLVQLVSDAHLNGFYYRPRTDLDHLARHAKGIIGLSGCINGVAAQYLLYNNYAKAREVTAQFVDIFGRENYFIEVQDHGIKAQRRIIPGLLRLAKEFDLAVVAANDVHYVRQEDWDLHDSLLCIQTGKFRKDEDRMRYPSHQFYLKSREEMAAVFPDNPEFLDNTLRVAEMVELEIPFGGDHYPVFPRPESIEIRSRPESFDRILDIYEEERRKVDQRANKEFTGLGEEKRAELKRNGLLLYDLCKKGLLERYGVDYENPGRSRCEADQGPEFAREVCERLDYELAIITGTGFVDYFLIVWDFIDWARRQGIPVGPGRGSGAGCLVAYVLRITDIDPLRFGLLFERMLNLERVSPPDFDVDFCKRRRDEVVEYVRDKYGREAVANIITYGTFGAKMILRDLARVNEIPFAEADRIAKMVPDELNISLEDAVEKSPDLKKEIKENPTAAEMFSQGLVIEGMVRNTGKHACGIIIADQPLTELVPVTLQEGDLTTQYAKGPVEDLGLLKMDFLGLKTLTVIHDTEHNVRRTRNLPDFSVEAVPLDDPVTYDLLNRGMTTGVFQLESGGMQALCRQIELSSFEEIIALIALYRPGPMQFIPQFIEGKKDPSKIQIPHPLLKDLVAETYGVLVYQEQVMQAARIIAGFSLGDADILRRAMGKKIKEVMDQQKDRFVKGAADHQGIDRRTATEIFAILEKFAKYGFNKSHSAAYAMLSYRTAYLKANYPVEFLAAVLSSELGDADKLAHFIEECIQMQIPVLGPDVNESRSDFTPVPPSKGGSGSIRFGLSAIKGVGESATAAIVEERERGGPYTSFADFVQRVDLQAVGRRVIECLVKTGAFDGVGEERAFLLENLESWVSGMSSARRDREQGQASLFGMLGEDEAGAASAGLSLREVPPMPTEKRLASEKELLGFYLSGHPLDRFGTLAEALDSFGDHELGQLEDRAVFRRCGVISSVEKLYSKKSNKAWSRFTLVTRRGNLPIIVFPDTFERIGAGIEENRVVAVSGSVGLRDGERSLRAEVIEPLEAVCRRSVERISLLIENGPAGAAALGTLRERLLAEPGSVEIILALPIGDKQALTYRIAGSLRWAVDPFTFRELVALPGITGHKIHVKGPDPAIAEPRWKPRVG